MSFEKFEISFPKNEINTFLSICNGLYDRFAFFPTYTDDKIYKYSIGYIGEKEGEVCQIQETLMEHLDSAQIEETIG